ncbi:MAG: SAM-dependent DNA methyltransferase [Planctomycetes bacterium]|nr:SAM-dependent DNA methyltransferase [Planctomycetota bacterium]
MCRESPRIALDPAVGPGVFVDAIAALPRHARPRELHLLDIDPVMIAKLRTPTSIACRVAAADFITKRHVGPFDAVIANPPYVRHHDFDYGPRAWRDLERVTGAPIPRTTNLYGLFVLKIGSLLSARGRAAIITPSEWLRADFGVALKSYLLRENLLDAIIQFDHGASVFDGVLTTACITLLRKGRRPADPIRCATVSDERGLAALDFDAATSWLPAELQANEKWNALDKRSTSDRSTRKLSDFATCSRGIATGANDYFTLRPSDLKKWKIARRDVRPCITKARQIRRDRITADDLRRLITEDERVFLLQPGTPLNPAVRSYLEHGKKRGVHSRYLPSHRPTWYLPEHRMPAPILISVFARGRFRIVWNEANVLNLTAYHGIYPRDGQRATARKLFEWLSSSAGHGALQAHVRLYADGLLKVEPKDVEAVTIPDNLIPTRGRPRAVPKRGLPFQPA